jgi:MFS superfamily sulfate permease-like transporter
MSTDRVPRESTEHLERWVPGIGMIRRYQPGWLRSDFVAGIVLAAILVPQGMAYAELAGLPAVRSIRRAIQPR